MKNKNRTLKKELFKLNQNNFRKLFLLKKYNTLPEIFNYYIINNIIFNINSRKVSHFKDFLIYDDPNDFMSQFYFKKESILLLKYYISFYEENNKIFPNYFCLSESKYLYNNIQKKQNILNNIENINFKLSNKTQSYSTIFSSSIKRSIYNESVFPSNSVNSKENDDLKKLIKIINDNYASISNISKKEKLSNDSLKNLQQNNNINKDIEKLAKTNNLSSCYKKSLFSRKKDKIKNIKKKINFENNWSSDKDKNSKEKKYKRVNNNYNKEIINFYGNKKNSREGGKTGTTESKEKLKNLIKTIKLIIEKNKNNNYKFKNINQNHHAITEIDNINININTNNKITISSRNLEKNTNVNNKILKSVLNSIILNKKYNKSNIKKNKINKVENLKQYLHKKTKIDHGNNSYKEVYYKLGAIKNEYKTNKNLLNHIKINSNINSNILTETTPIINNAYHTILTNNNSVSFNSPFSKNNKTNKSTSIESFTKLQISTQKKNKKKILIKNYQKSKRKTLTDVYNMKDNQDRNKNIINNNIKKFNKYFGKENKKETKDFSTQPNLRTNKKNINKYKNISKDFISKTRSSKKENKSFLITKSYINGNLSINPNSSIIKNNNCSKRSKLGKRNRNNTALNNLNINLNNIKNFKMLNNLYATINIYRSSRNNNNIRNGLKTERTNCKLTYGTYLFDNKNLIKKLNASNIYTNLNRKKRSNIILSNNLLKIIHNKKNLNSVNNIETTFPINKTSNNLNNLLKKNILHNSTYNYFVKIKNKKPKNVRLNLIKKNDKDFIKIQNSSRIRYKNKNKSFKLKVNEYSNIIYRNKYLNIMESGKKTDNAARKWSNDEKKLNIESSYSSSENNKKKQKKIKLKNFKKLIGKNMGSEKKEIDRIKLQDMLNEKKSHIHKISSSKS